MKSNQLRNNALLVVLAFAVVLTLGTSAQAEMKVSGFADAQYGWDNSGSPTGFTVNDGAVYFNASNEMGFAMVDIPFAGTATNAFSIAGAKTQAYVGKKYDMGLSWQMGQWDTIWGTEAVDSKDVFFAKRGQVSTLIVPSVHAGALLGYKFTEMLSLNVIVANATGSGSSTGVYNYAGQLKYSGDSFWFKGGYSFQTAGADTSLIDVSAGTKAGSLDVSVGFDMADVAASTDNQMGIVGNLIYTSSDTCSYGLRFDYISKVAGTADTGIYGTLGASHKATKELTGKVNYTFSSVTATAGGTSTTGHAVDLAAVYAF